MLNIKPQKFWFAVLALLVLVFIAIPAIKDTTNKSNLDTTASLNQHEKLLAEYAPSTENHIKIFEAKPYLDGIKIENASPGTQIQLTIYAKNLDQEIVPVSVIIQEVDNQSNIPIPLLGDKQYIKVQTEATTNLSEENTGQIDNKQIIIGLPRFYNEQNKIKIVGDQEPISFNYFEDIEYTFYLPKKFEEVQSFIFDPSLTEKEKQQYYAAVVVREKDKNTTEDITPEIFLNSVSDNNTHTSPTPEASSYNAITENNNSKNDFLVNNQDPANSDSSSSRLARNGNGSNPVFSPVFPPPPPPPHFVQVAIQKYMYLFHYVILVEHYKILVSDAVFYQVLHGPL